MHTLLELFIDFAEKKGISGDAFIVGGAVRDILLEKKLKDIDIAIKGDALNIARKFAKEVGGTFVLLDEKFGVARIVKNSFFLDISMMRGDSVYTDIAERDITINAMAIPLTKGQGSRVKGQEKTRLEIIDPFNGRDDLFNGIIRMVSEENLIKDPLRILRIYRFAATLNFSIDENTLNAAERLAPLITSAAVERIAEELRYIVRLDDSYKTMKAIMDNRILVYIFPEVKEEVRVQSLELYKNVEDILNNPSYFLPPTFKRICLKLSTLFPDAESAKNTAIRLKMSRKEVEFIHKMALNRDKFLNFYKETEGNPDEIKTVRLLKEFHDDVYALTILALAQETSIISFCKKLITFYNDVFKPRTVLLPIITGDDIMNIFNLKPSPLFKKILDTVEELVLKGIIVSKEEAMKKVSEMLKTK